MHFEINIPDSTKPEIKAQIGLLVQRLNEKPEIVEEIELDDEAAIQRMFTPERLAHIDRALADVKAGNFYTLDQVREHFARKEAVWNQANRP